MVAMKVHCHGVRRFDTVFFGKWRSCGGCRCCRCGEKMEVLLTTLLFSSKMVEKIEDGGTTAA